MGREGLGGCLVVQQLLLHAMAPCHAHVGCTGAGQPCTLRKHPKGHAAAFLQCRLRISLGLKPLKMEADKPAGPSKEELRRKEEEEKAAQAEEIAERVKQ